MDQKPDPVSQSVSLDSPALGETESSEAQDTNCVMSSKSDISQIDSSQAEKAPKTSKSSKPRRRLARRRQYNKSYLYHQSIRSSFVPYDDAIESAGRNSDSALPLEFVSEPEPEPESERAVNRLEWSATIISSPNELITPSQPSPDSSNTSRFHTSTSACLTSNPSSKSPNDLNSSGSLDSPSSSRAQMSSSTSATTKSKLLPSNKSNTNFFSSFLNSRKRFEVSTSSNELRAHTSTNLNGSISPQSGLMSRSKPLEKSKRLSKSTMRIETPKLFSSTSSASEATNLKNPSDLTRMISLEYPPSSSYVLSDFAILQLVSFTYSFRNIQSRS